MSEHNEILDQFQEQKPQNAESKFWQLFPAALFLVGFGLSLLRVPGATIIMIGALVLASVRLSLRFFRKPRKFFEWSYFLGNICLMIAACLSILRILELNFVTLGPSMLLFLAGILTTGNQRN